MSPLYSTDRPCWIVLPFYFRKEKAALFVFFVTGYQRLNETPFIYMVIFGAWKRPRDPESATLLTLENQETGARQRQRLSGGARCNHCETMKGCDRKSAKIGSQVPCALVGTFSNQYRWNCSATFAKLRRLTGKWVHTWAPILSLKRNQKHKSQLGWYDVM